MNRRQNIGHIEANYKQSKSFLSLSKNHKELKSKSHYSSKQSYPHNTLNYCFNLKDKNQSISNTRKQNNNMTRVTFKEWHMHVYAFWFSIIYNRSQINHRQNMGHIKGNLMCWLNWVLSANSVPQHQYDIFVSWPVSTWRVKFHFLVNTSPQWSHMCIL